MSIRDQILAKNDQEQKLTETGYRWVTKINPYWPIMENLSRNFSEIFVFRVVTQANLLENSSIRFFTETIHDM